MCHVASWIAAILFGLGPLMLMAQDRPLGPPAKRVVADGAASAAVVAIDVVIADVGPAEKDDAAPEDKDVAVRIREWEKQGKLTRLTRTYLTTISEQQATAQFGERVPMATGRVFRGGGFAGGPGGAGDGSTSYTYQNIGTLVNVVPKVEGDRVVMDCSFECTRVVPRKPSADKPEASFEPTSLETISAKSVVTIISGATVLLTSKQSSGGEGVTRTYVLVTATIQDPGRKEAAALKVYTLVHAKADGVAETLARVFGESAIKLSVDERSNSVVAKGTAEDLDLVEALLHRLDDR